MGVRVIEVQNSLESLRNGDIFGEGGVQVGNKVGLFQVLNVWFFYEGTGVMEEF